MTKIDENIKAAQNTLGWIVERCYELEKENKNMKLTLEQMENTCKDYLNDRDTFREENETLKDNIEFLHQCLDDRDKSIEVLKEENKKLNYKVLKLKSKVAVLEWKLCKNED